MAILYDGKPRAFRQILSEAGFSHNTFGLYLDELVDRGLIARAEEAPEGPWEAAVHIRIVQRS